MMVSFTYHTIAKIPLVEFLLFQQTMNIKTIDKSMCLINTGNVNYSSCKAKEEDFTKKRPNTTQKFS